MLKNQTVTIMLPLY